MYGIPGVESLALRVTRAKAALRWATSEGTLGHEVSGFEKKYVCDNSAAFAFDAYIQLRV